MKGIESKSRGEGKLNIDFSCSVMLEKYIILYYFTCLICGEIRNTLCLVLKLYPLNWTIQ